MTDPLSLLPLAIAARGGTIDGRPASQWVAAGLTLLQRSAPVVRALAGRRSAILLPTSAHFLAALGASEGRAALLLDTETPSEELRSQMARADVGALFTLSSCLTFVPDVPVVCLDRAPRYAQMRAGDDIRDVELGSHFPLDLEGDADAAGIDEDVAVAYAPQASGEQQASCFTHRELLARGRALCRSASLSAEDRVLAALPYADPGGLLLGAVAPLLCGARVTTLSVPSAESALAAIDREGITTLAGTAELFDSLLQTTTRVARLGRLRVCLAPAGPLVDAGIGARWESATGVRLLLD